MSRRLPFFIFFFPLSRPSSYLPCATPFSSPRSCLHSLRPLPSPVIHHLTSGQVIPNAVSLLSELVENSLDAKSTFISIHLDFPSLLLVSDNGEGISVHDLPSVGQLHTTSKLRSLEHLQQGVATLGFRGQALSAVSHVAEHGVQMESRLRGQQNCGYAVQIGKEGLNVVPMAPGTCVKVRGLQWGKHPAERRNLDITCRHWLLGAALCHPNVSFRLRKRDKIVWTTTGKGRVASLAAYFGKHLADFRQIEKDIEGVGKICIVAGLPGIVNVVGKTGIIVGINGRCVQLDSLRDAITNIMCVKKGRTPVVFVHVEMDRGEIDWNVSPTKNIVSIKEKGGRERMETVVCKLLSDLMRGVRGADYVQPVSAEQEWMGDSKVMEKLMSIVKDGKAQNEGEKEGKRFEDEDEILPQFGVRNGRVVAQVLQTYMLVEYDGGIILAEQHIADERGIYEQLIDDWKSSRFVTLADPLRLKETVTEETLFSLESLGFDIDLKHETVNGCGNESWYVKNVPAVMKDIPTDMLKYLIMELARASDCVEDAAAAVSCRLAIRNGTKLSNSKMTKIFSRLMKCDNPHTCPHGRPIFVNIQAKQLAKLFGRSWYPERVTSKGTPTQSNRSLIPE